MGVIFCHVGLGLNLGHLGVGSPRPLTMGFKLIIRPIGQRHGHTGSRGLAVGSDAGNLALLSWVEKT